MNTKMDSGCQSDEPFGKPIPTGASFDSRGHSGGYRTHLRCPHCGGSDLNKVSLAYQKGVSRVTARTRFRGLLFGNDGPDLVFGTTVTKGERQTELAGRLRPPKKWSYLKLLGWTSVISLAVLIVYVHSVMGSSTKVSGLPAVAGMFVVASGFLISLFVVWRHNYWVYPRRHAEWNDSWLCQRCGWVSSQGLG
jgi:hypothetical protein